MKTNKNYSAYSAWELGGASETRTTTSAVGTSAVRRAAMTLAAATTTRRAAMMLLMMMLTATTAWAEELGGYNFTVETDNEGSYYKVDCEAALRALSAYVNSSPNNSNNNRGKRFKQTANITLTGGNFEPIGNCLDGFAGTYDGNLKTISGLTIEDDGYSVGLFSQATGTVKNVILISPVITSNYDMLGESFPGCVGGIAGVIYNDATVDHCYVTNPTFSSKLDKYNSYVAYIVAEAYTQHNSPTISNCYYYDSNTSHNWPIVKYDEGTETGNGRAFAVNFGASVSTSTAAIFTVGSTHYYASGTTITLAELPSSLTNIYYTVNGSRIDGNSFTMSSADAVVERVFIASGSHFSGSGTQSDPYVIHDETGWNYFCDLLAETDQGFFTDRFIKLDNNISVTRMAGSEGHEFTGTFDGDGHTINVSYGSANQRISEDYAAPFRYAGGIYDNDSHSCTIKNLRVAGTIYTSAQFAAGFVGFNNTNGYISLENCRSSVVINSSVSGDGTHGGFVARRKGSYILYIRGCLFDGEFHGSNTTKWGGFVGYRNSGSIYMYHSIFAPTAVEIDKTESATFIRNGINNYFRCYYTEDINDGTNYTGQGHRMRSITPGTDVTVGLNDSPATYYNVSDITNYGSIYSSDPGLKYGDTYYAGSGEQVSVTLGTSRTGYVASSYTASNGGTVSGNATDGWTLTMPDADVTVSATFAPDPEHFAVSGNEYTIKSATGWGVFCDLLDGGTSFSGKTVTLSPSGNSNGITVTRMAGSSGHDFKGTFDGGGYTLIVSYEDAGDNTRTAPFAYVDGATIQNLIVDGSITDNGYRAAGFIGETGTTTSYITNCVSSLTIIGDRYTGGFSIGGNVEIEGCVFNGTITGSSQSGGFVGYSNSALKIKNSLFAPQSGSSISGGTFYYNGDAGTLTNSYYTETLGEAQGKAPHTVTGGTNVSIDGLALTGSSEYYDVSGITAYDNGGINYNNTLYCGSGDQVSLTLANSGGDAPAGYQYGYTANAGTLSGDANPYTLTMPDEDVTITAALTVIPWTGKGTQSEPWFIRYPSQLDLLASRVNGTNGETLQEDGYKNNYFELGADITYSHDDDANLAEYPSNYTAIGGYFDGKYRSFKGTFDGKGHTVSGIRIYKGGVDNSDNFQGLFGKTEDGATIRGITLADARITGYNFTGGIVGNNGVGSTVSHCHVAATVAIHAVQNAHEHGGIVGYNDDQATVSNCTSAATLTKTSSGGKGYGGIAGYNNSGTLSHNLAIGAVVPAGGDNYNGAICGYNYATLLNNYYLACTVAGVENATDAGCGIPHYSGFSVDYYYTADVTANDGAVSALRDNADNSTALGLLAALATAGLDGTPLDLGWGAGKYPMQLAGRTLYKDGDWNTLCLPFSMTAEQVTAQLAPDELMTLSTSSFAGGTLSLTFEDASTIEAGKPYIIKWENTEGTEPTEDTELKNPVFWGVTVPSGYTSAEAITAALATASSSTDYVDFIGTFSPEGIYESGTEKHNLYLGADNKLYYPTATDFKVKACRGWFQLKNGLTCGTPSGNGVREFVLNFGDETTGVALIDNGELIMDHEAGAWYDLSGRRVSVPSASSASTVLPKGVYIHNGRKVVVK